MSEFASLTPTNPLVGAMLTDMYQISMTYAHWKSGRTEDHTVFDLFFRKSPFRGEFCIFAGTDEIIRLLNTFRFTESDVAYLQSIMPFSEPAFFQWLLTLDCSQMTVYAMHEGSVVFPREPLVRVEGPLAVGQLLETALLNLVNFPSLVATCASRMRLCAGPNKTLLEFGLRRAQGPDGGLSATKYAYVGGFDGSSNVLAGKLMDIAVRGTHAHAFVMCYSGISELSTTRIRTLADPAVTVEFVELVLEKRRLLGYPNTNEGELAAFIAYAQACPHYFLTLVDTYDTVQSGVPNFMAVGWALSELGFEPKGIRLDSGDLAYLSKLARGLFKKADAIVGSQVFAHLNIVASNDINEEVLVSLNREGHEIDTFGIGTHLVTCHQQPALGCVYKLVEINKKPRIKLSQEVEKLVIPGRKSVYRLFGRSGQAILDLIQLSDEPAPVAGEAIMCRHPFQENKRALVTPSRVEPLLRTIWDKGPVVAPVPLVEARLYRQEQLAALREDHIRQTNPTPFKTSISEHLYHYMHQLWLKEAPISELS